MHGVGLASLLLITAVTLIVGTRLLLVARRTRQLPEALFGFAFFAGGLGTILPQIGDRALAPAAAYALSAGAFGVVVLGTVALYTVIWRVFGRGRNSALAICVVGSAAALASFAFRLASGEFGPDEIGGLGALAHLVVRIAFFAWAAFEAFRYHGLLKRRVALGLASPVVAQQILLWGVAATGMLGTSAVLILWVYALGISPLSSASASLLLLVTVVGTSVCIWCAFFPPAALRARALQRSAA